MASTASMVLRLRAAPRCHSRSKRTKLPCQAPAVRGHKVCRFHGARGGAPKGNRNAWKHGLHSADWLAEKGRLRAIIKTSRALIKKARLRVQEVVPSNSGTHLPPEDNNHHRDHKHYQGQNHHQGHNDPIKGPVTPTRPSLPLNRPRRLPRFGVRVNFPTTREHQTGPPCAKTSSGKRLPKVCFNAGRGPQCLDWLQAPPPVAIVRRI